MWRHVAMSADFPPIAPLDVPAPGELPPPPAAPAPPHRLPIPHHPTRSAVDGRRRRQARSGPRHLEPAPSVAVAQYDPRTGRYVGPDGKLYQQSDLATPKAPKTWQDMLPT